MMIETFQWNDKFSVGIDMIDKQHQGFFSIANSIIALTGQAGHQEHNKKELISIFERLMYYALYHFSTEEELFYRYKFPKTVEHMDEHEAFHKKLSHLSDQIWVEGTDIEELLDETAHFTITWLSNHILVTDMAYSNFFQAQGIK